MISDIKLNIINKLVNNFISNFRKKEMDIKKYIFNLIEEIIMAFSFKAEVDQKSKRLIQN